ncbi:hypothetical protein N5079_33520 [Planotetraspora sp. A-T 1434]|uniref:hypothetical protein n=1 Tax=Planotetraspora sp. A-T 1434 TaxID=2979219 RepID=UPI0021C1D55D|nr:hypothetical protein [Planotetraspora sp. A-T 1434]MCT9935133.1 hypothetical protein [Planotetraspora sp. A-T 1434]
MLTDIEAYYADLLERADLFGELCVTWCRAASADLVIHALDVDVFDVTVGGLQDLIYASYEDLMEGTLPRFMLLAEEPPWFFTVEYGSDRAFEALERLSSETAETTRSPTHRAVRNTGAPQPQGPTPRRRATPARRFTV